MKTLIIINLAATLMMVGVIWLIQIVHYPLFNRVGEEGFTQYEAAHTTRITLVVMPLMLVEAITALLLALQPPQGISTVLMWGALGLVVVVWGSTFFIQLPAHTRLSVGFDADAYRTLVDTNWIRTIAWSLRGAIMLGVVVHLLDKA